MTKNKLEKLFSKSLKQLDWGIKLHNNPLAHQNTPADYIATHFHLYTIFVYLFECKQVTCDEKGNGRLTFKRLKQMHDLIAFENITEDLHQSYFCIAYYDGRWATSNVYLVPVKVMKLVTENHNAKSLNRQDAKIFLDGYEIYVEGGELQLLKKLYR